jgi:hypothetical protein
VLTIKNPANVFLHVHGLFIECPVKVSHEEKEVETLKMLIYAALKAPIFVGREAIKKQR